MLPELAMSGAVPPELQHSDQELEPRDEQLSSGRENKSSKNYRVESFFKKKKQGRVGFFCHHLLLRLPCSANTISGQSESKRKSKCSGKKTEMRYRLHLRLLLRLLCSANTLLDNERNSVQTLQHAKSP